MSPTRRLRRFLAGASIAVGAAVALSFAGGAVSGGLIGNFEQDGDMIVDVAGHLDWTNAPNRIVLTDDTLDSGLSGGKKEEQPSEWTCLAGNDPNKANILRAYFDPRIYQNQAYLDLGWVRQNTNGKGDTHLNFELNQLAQTTPAIPAQGTVGCAPNRIAGDLLVTYDFDGGNTDPDIKLFSWDATPSGQDEGSWVEIDLNGNVGAAVNTVANGGGFTDPITGDQIDAARFGEATLNLSAALSAIQRPCMTFAAAGVRSRASGQSISSNLEDVVFSQPFSLSTCGHVTIVKDTVPDAAQDFSFTTSAGVNGGAGFNLDDDSDATLPNSRSFDIAAIGQAQSVTEAASAGYTLDAINCTGTGSSTPNVATRTLAFTVNVGDNLTCTFVNKRNPQLTVIKHVVNDNGGSAAASDFSMHINGVTVTGTNPFAGAEAPGATREVAAGSYNVTETGPAGYAATFSADCTGTIALGESKTCTITNDDQAAHLNVIKHVINDNGGTLAAPAFLINVSGPGAAPANFAGAEAPGTSVAINPGNYTVTETPATGYTPSYSADCSGSIALGETKTCTVTNDDQAANLIVIKHVINNDGGTAVASNFTMIVGGTNVAPAAAFPGAEAGTPVTLNAGGYTVNEIGGPPGYTQSLSADCSGTIANGQTKVCTITNDDQPATLHVIKEVVNDDGGTALAGDFTINVTGIDASPASFAGAGTPGTAVGLKAGAYSVAEVPAPGYSVSYSADCTGSIANGESKTCTVTNNDDPAHLIVVKKVVNDNGGTATSSDFTMSIGGVTVVGDASFPGADDPGTSRQVHPGTFSVTESGPTGYNGDFVGCNGTIALGETKTCVVTNDDQAASLTIIKHVVNDNGGTATADDFTMNINGITAQSGNSFPGADVPGVTRIVTPGDYTVTESGPAGYAATLGDDCAGSIALGEHKTCRIVNDDQAAHLIVIKHVINDNGGTSTASNFTMNINGITAQSGNSFPGAEAPGVSREVTPGAYTVTEAAVATYQASYSAGCAGTIALGETKTCTVTNNDVSKYGNPGTVVIPEDPYGSDPGDTTPSDPYTPPSTPATTAAPVVDPLSQVAGETRPAEPAPEQVLGSEAERPAPDSGLLPRTGAGIAGEALLALLMVGAGLALMRITRRRRTQPQG